MKLSIFTPSHKAEHLSRCYASLCSQLHVDGVTWEWIVVLNQNAEYVNGDTRVKIVRAPDGLNGVGALKKFATELCSGDVLIELDHDDELLPKAFCKIVEKARENSEAFIFSSTIELDEKGNDKLFGSAFGWVHREYKGHKYNEAFTPCARSLAEIFYAPNHVRAWTRRAYEKVGGHNAKLEVCDDLEIIMRTYLAGVEFLQLDFPVYVQHLQASSTQFARNQEIQTLQADLRDCYLPMLAQEWARREGLSCLDLGGAHGCPAGYQAVDKVSGSEIEWDITQDLLSFAQDNSVGCVRAHDFLEHVPPSRVVALMNDIYRVLAPGGWLLVSVPSTDGRGAFQDPTHVSFWNENSFWYYTRAQQAKYVPEITARFQAVTLKTWFPSSWHKQYNISYVVANLSALKGQRQAGRTEI